MEPKGAKRILFISASDPRFFGGQEIQTLSLMEGLQEDYEFFLVAQEGPLSQKAREIGVKVVISPLRQKNLLQSIWRVKKIVEENQISIIHTLELRGNLIGRLAALFSKAKPKIVATRHELIFSPFFPLPKKLKRWIYLTFERITAKYCDQFITVSKAVQKELVRRAKVPSQKVNVIYNGLNIEEIKLKKGAPKLAASFSALDAQKKIGWVGRLVLEKGLEDLIISAKEILRNAEVKFIVIGDGPDKELLQAEVEKRGLGSYFFFLGFEPNIYPYLSLFDLFVFTSYHESLGMTLIEAMALEKAVVATKVGGVPEVVEDGESGILVRPGKPQELSKAIIELLADDEKRQKMGQRGFQIAKEKFALKRMLEETKGVYEKVLSRN